MTTSRIRRVPGQTVARWLLVVALVLLAAGAGWWAARATLVSDLDAREDDVADTVVWAEVTTGSVGRSLPLSVTVRQPLGLVAQNALTGVVTEARPGEVAQGGIAYVVGSTPVRVVAADRPFWRELGRGTKGGDVAALQGALRDLGLLSSPADGDFGASTEAAVRAWQRSLSQPATGIVPLGEVIAVATLPATIELGEEIIPGVALAGGEDAVLAPTGERQFVLVVTAEQARLIPQDATVDVTLDDITWTAVVATTSINANGDPELLLTGPDGGPVCAGECDVLPRDPQLTLRGEVVITPAVTGLAVPAAAVLTRADGTTLVRTEMGEVDVDVLGSGQGLAIVSAAEPDAVQEGTLVALPSTQQE
ncbi:peptidoglycan-binding domain-containing protein [Salana multivorans]